MARVSSQGNSTIPWVAPAPGERGLTEQEASARLETYGPNVVPPHGRRSAVVEYALHFRNPLVLMLIAASIVLGFTGDARSMTIIIAIVLASVTLDFVQEHRAERALSSLQSTIAATAVVMRSGIRQSVLVSTLVPGDMVVLTAGDIAPADGYVIEADRLYLNESALTGEAYPLEKCAYRHLCVGRDGRAVSSNEMLRSINASSSATY